MLNALKAKTQNTHYHRKTNCLKITIMTVIQMSAETVENI